MSCRRDMSKEIVMTREQLIFSSPAVLVCVKIVYEQLKGGAFIKKKKKKDAVLIVNQYFIIINIIGQTPPY